jgi:hypothetical protein
VAVPLAALGSLPWIIWNVAHGFGSLSVRPGGSSNYAHRLRLFFSPVMPMIAGLRTPFTQERLLPASLTFLIHAALVVLFISVAPPALAPPPEVCENPLAVRSTSVTT